MTGTSNSGLRERDGTMAALTECLAANTTRNPRLWGRTRLRKLSL